MIMLTGSEAATKARLREAAPGRPGRLDPAGHPAGVVRPDPRPQGDDRRPRGRLDATDRRGATVPALRAVDAGAGEGARQDVVVGIGPVRGLGLRAGPARGRVRVGRPGAAETRSHVDQAVAPRRLHLSLRRDGHGRRRATRASASEGPSFQPLVRQSSTSNVAFSGAWTRAESSGYSRAAPRSTPRIAGATASYTFTGTQRRLGRGDRAEPGLRRRLHRRRVPVDGQPVRGTAATRQIVFVASWATQGSHTIEIVVAGTPGHPRVDVDAFVRVRRL